MSARKTIRKVVDELPADWPPATGKQRDVTRTALVAVPTSDPIAEAAQRLADAAPPIPPGARDRLAAIFRSARMESAARSQTGGDDDVA